MFDGQQRILITNARYKEMYRVELGVFPAGSAPDAYVAEVLACLSADRPGRRSPSSQMGVACLPELVPS